MFRDLRVLVVHPRDRDGESLLRGLQRLGCQAEHRWPAPERMPEAMDVIICLVGKETQGLVETLVDNPHVAVIGVADSAHPDTLSLLADMGPQAVVNRPVEAGAVAIGLLVACNNARYQRRLVGKVAKLDETLRSMRKVERAKAILMERRRIDESAAYAFLRDQAMRRRVPIGVVASVVVDANEVLPDGLI
jgi:AmiR/NasT family two-component response regulator